MAEHAKLMSPSSAARRIACPGSYVLESALPDTASQASDDGTAMHAVAAWCLGDPAAPYVDPHGYVGRYIDVHDKGEPQRRVQFTEAMADLTRTYVDRIRRMAIGGELAIERKVDFSQWVDMPVGTQFGTLDARVWYAAERRLDVHDLKTGYHRVDPSGPQLKLYALGEMAALEMLGDQVDEVHLYIHQPKLSDEPFEHVMTRDELMQFADHARKATHACKAAEWNMKGGGKDFAETYLVPGEEQCRFCKANKAQTCPAVRGVVARVVTFTPTTNSAVADDFDVVDDVGASETGLVVQDTTAIIPHLSDDQIGRLYAMVPLVESWAKNLSAEVERRILAGRVVQGFKAVQGRKGARAWTDAEQAEAQLKAMRLKVEEMYDLKLISPTSAEKLTKATGDDKPALGPRQWQKLQSLITQPEGKPTVVPVTDKRPALQITPPADDFEVVGAAEPVGVEALV